MTAHDAAWGSEWDEVADVVIVGGGAAAFAAAWSASRAGASVIVLEKAPIVGGTTAKSGGVMWIPNNHHMKSAGLVDERESAIRYMARCAYPTLYDPAQPHLGLPEDRLRLIEVFYDAGARYVEDVEREGVVEFAPLDYPDYNAQLPEDTAPRGRSLKLKYPATWRKGVDSWGGVWLVESLEKGAYAHGARTLLEHRVAGVVRNEAGEVIGVEAHTGRRTKLIGARKGVIFGSGGFLHNPELRREFLRGPIFGGAASLNATGDLVGISSTIGARLGNMAHAWWDQVVLELTHRLTETIDDVYSAFGDSMIMVNRFGRRVVNEKAPYNERGQAHFAWDPHRLEYPNRVLFMIFDDDVVQNPAKSPFRWPVPMPGETADYVITADTLDELAAKINERLAKLGAFVSHVQLDDSFVGTLQATISRFNAMALAGRDDDFSRGETMVEQRWSVAGREGMPNKTMHPLRDSGPYHCILLGGGALDTKGGPVTDEFGRFIDQHGEVIEGIYGAGNCVASPAGQAYWGAGGTIGVAFTFGAIAGEHAASQPSRTPA